jgi:transcriptional regulator with XRE-family HTH domain
VSPRNNTLIATVARNIRDLRLKAGLSQEKLAELSGLHRTYIGGIERAERNITLASVEKIAEALHVAPPALLSSGKKRHV